MDLEYFLNGTVGELVEKLQELYVDISVLSEHPESAIISFQPGELCFKVSVSFEVEPYE